MLNENNFMNGNLIISRLLELKEAKGMTWEAVAKALYQILEGIDTVDDMCKGDIQKFRDVMMKLQARKNQYLREEKNPLEVNRKLLSFWQKRDDISQALFRKDYDQLDKDEKRQVVRNMVNASKVESVNELGLLTDEDEAFITKLHKGKFNNEKHNKLANYAIKKVKKLPECARYVIGLSNGQLAQYYQRIARSPKENNLDE